MSDLSIEGITQVNNTIENLNDTVENGNASLADTFKDGIKELKEQILKVAVDSLPKDFLDVAKNVEKLTTYTTQISNILDESRKEKEKENVRNSENEKMGASNGWTPDKLASKVPEREAAPSLTIIQSISDLFGDKGTFFLGIKDLLSSISDTTNKSEIPEFFDTSGIFTTTIKNLFSNFSSSNSSLSNLDSYFSDKGIFTLAIEKILKPLLDTGTVTKKPKQNDSGEDLKGLNTKTIDEYSEGMRKLNKLFGRILGVFFYGNQPKFSQEQIKSIEITSKVFEQIGIVFEGVSKSVKSVIFAGPLAILATKFLPMIDNFIALSADLILKFKEYNISEEDTKSLMVVTNSLVTIFSQIIQAELNAIIAGLLAIPAAILILPILTFVASTVLLMKVFSFIPDTVAAKGAEKAKNLNIFFESIAKAELYAIMAGVLAIPAAIFAPFIIIFVNSVSTTMELVNFIDLADVSESAKRMSSIESLFNDILMAEIKSIAAGILALPAAIFLLFVSTFLVSVGLLLTIADTFLKKEKLARLNTDLILLNISLGLILVSEGLSIGAGILAIPAIVGVLLISVFLLGIVLLGLIAKLALGNVITLTVVSLLSIVVMKGFSISIPIVAALAPLLVQTLIGMATIAVFMVGMVAIGLLASFAIGSLLALTVASLLTLATLTLFKLSLMKLVEINKYLNDNLRSDETGFKTGTVLDSVLGFLFALLPMALIMVGFFFVGLLAIICILPMLGLLLFSLIAVTALPMFAQSLVLLFDVITQASDLIKGEAPQGGILDALYGLPEPIGGTIKAVVGILSFLGKLVPLILILVAIGVIGILAGVVSLALVGLETFAKTMATSIPQLISGLELLPNLLETVERVDRQLKGMPAEKEEREGFGKVIGFFKDVGSNIVGSIGALGKWASLVMMMMSIGAVGIASAAAIPGLKSLQAIGNALGEGIPGLVAGLTSIPSLLSLMATTNVNESDFNKIKIIISSLSRIGAGIKNDVANIEAIKTASETFKLSLEENILQPIMRLDPAITKLNSLKTAAAELNAELKKLTSENKDAVSTLVDIGSSASNRSGVVGVSTTRTNQDQNNASENMGYSKQDTLLEFISEDVHGIAQKLIQPQNVSWLDRAVPKTS